MNDSDFYYYQRQDYMENGPPSEPKRVPGEFSARTNEQLAQEIAKMAINMELLEARVSDLERQLAKNGSE